MFGIPMAALAKVAQQPTAHTWMAPVMASTTTESRDSELELRLSRWIETLTENEEAERIVREVLLLSLERRAVARLVATEPRWARSLPVVGSAAEAARLGAREAMADEEAEAEAQGLLELLESGALQPPRELLA